MDFIQEHKKSIQKTRRAWNHELMNLKKDRGYCGKASNAAYSKNSSRRATKVQAVTLVYRRPQNVCLFLKDFFFNVALVAIIHRNTDKNGNSLKEQDSLQGGKMIFFY
jgi:hypothetical protein